jgi:hypothetical protein
VKAGLGTLLSIAAFGLSAVMAWSGYVHTSNDDATKLEARIHVLESRLDRLEEADKASHDKLAERFKFMRDSKQILDELCGEIQKCRLRYGPVYLPE